MSSRCGVHRLCLPPAPWASGIMSFRRREDGSSLIEFSLILPLVLLMFIGVVNFGFAVAESMSVQDAARAGAEYGSLPGKSTDLAGMQSAARNAAAGVSTLDAAANNLYSCTPNSSPIQCSGSCPSSCASGGSPMIYVQVQTSATVPTVLGIATIATYTGLPTSLTLQGFAALRVQ